LPPKLIELGNKLAAAEHKKFLESGEELSEAILEADETLGVYTLRLSNKERLFLRGLAVRTGRPAAEIARDFIRQGIERTLSPGGKLRPDSELGIKHLAFIAQSLRSFVSAFEADDLSRLANEQDPEPGSKKAKGSRNRA
jgi:hypothetical protein